MDMTSLSTAAGTAAAGPIANGTATGYATGDLVFKPKPEAIVEATPTQLALLDAGKARQELAASTMAQIERATALSWGGRALACYEPLAPGASIADPVQRFCDGEAYRQEAFEHAAMADEDGTLLNGIRAEIDSARAAALLALQPVASVQSA